MLQYPLDLRFKIVTLGTRVRVTDAIGTEVAYLRKKKFRLKEEVTVYADEVQSRVLFRINADRMLDFSANYAISGGDGVPLGAVRRQGMRSIWRTSYGIADATRTEIGGIREENAWVKVADSLLEMLPFGDALGGLFFNPSYLISVRSTPVLRLRKRRALFEGRFTLEKLADIPEREEQLLLASTLMMLILERDRG
ncbi:MAG: hypothetical protein AVDCRST_MAG28-2212 [uncultured Rubrobacteraceae bacterium]|uniref:Uncharacterized protein n=1 Tax=uncultured Rubrobacteraceae bacterium TaxID=349277 RepID=A0A6J4QWL4_9ACTN|nr:MAG: hypothetical protein AVDCRST_MAG28-2212 [uncultured Rubrobacteraceae bacterium]